MKGICMTKFILTLIQFVQSINVGFVWEIAHPRGSIPGPLLFSVDICDVSFEY